MCPSVKNILLLDSEGKRVAVKYYSDDWPTNSSKLAFEKSVFTKTLKSNARVEGMIQYISYNQHFLELEHGFYSCDRPKVSKFCQGYVVPYPWLIIYLSIKLSTLNSKNVLVFFKKTISYICRQVHSLIYILHLQPIVCYFLTLETLFLCSRTESESFLLYISQKMVPRINVQPKQAGIACKFMPAMVY